MAGGTMVGDLRAGELVEATFAVTRKQRRSRRDGRPFIDVELSDRTGRVAARVWESVVVLDGRFDVGDTVRVLGRVAEYDGRLEVELRDVERLEPGNPEELVPGARRDIEVLDGFVDFLVGEIADVALRGLVEAVFGERGFRERFRTAPATEHGHHDYAGGLIEHTVAVCTLCREVAQLHPRLDVDLLIASALLHDCGTVDVFAPGPVIRATMRGSAIGHIHCGLTRIQRQASRLQTPEPRLTALLACVAAHHGPIEGRRPLVAEAVALQLANSLDARTAEAL